MSLTHDNIGEFQNWLSKTGAADRPASVNVRSQCHRYRGGWTPEEGSLEYDLAEDKRHFKGRSALLHLGTKLHWAGSKCTHVIGRWAFLAKDRVLDGEMFMQVHPSIVCGNCQNQFDNA